MTTAARHDDIDKEIMIAALGLAGESGEFADKIKKWTAQGHHFDHDGMIEELGDILWYVAYAANVLGYTLGCVANENIIKLQRRYPDGFSSDRSMNRDYADQSAVG
jgi:NTP pyrophosphatase (non-canonical NTP hydrolase)